MTFAQPELTPQAKTRPGTVTTSAAIQFILLILGLLGTIFVLMYNGDMTAAGVAELEAQGASVTVIDGYEASAGLWTVGLLVFVLVLNAVYALLGVFNMRGSRGSRITTWVFSGVLLLCGAFGLMPASSSVVDGIDYATVAVASAEAMPSWFNSLNSISMIVSLVGYAAVIILLAMPASNEFFRKPIPTVILPGDKR